MSGHNVAGRGLIDPKWEAHPVAEDGVVIRVDDEGNPEFWLEVFIPRADLEAMLAAVRVVPTPEGVTT